MSNRPGEIPAALVDELTEAVATPGDPVLRALVITEIIEQIVEAVAWRHGSHPYVPERASLALLAAATDDHVRRMMGLSNSCFGASPSVGASTPRSPQLSS